MMRLFHILFGRTKFRAQALTPAQLAFVGGGGEPVCERTYVCSQGTCTLTEISCTFK
jgi:hypothetical protein